MAHKNKTRNIWFMERPVREPNHRLALLALDEATDHFSNIIWDRNKTLQKHYEDCLGKWGAKRKGHGKYGSGGRTWLALLRAFDYVYLIGKPKHRIVKPNEIAKEIIKGHNASNNITKQILTLQIPNTYFLSSGFTHSGKYASDFKIQPVRFLCRIANNKCLNYKLSETEIIYFVMTCHKNSELNKALENILKFRNLDTYTKNKVENDIATKYGAGGKGNAYQRSFIKKYKDVANTYMILASFTHLVKRKRSNTYGPELYVNSNDVPNNIKILDKFDKLYPFNNKYKISKMNFILNAGLPVGKHKANLHPNQKTASNHYKNNIEIKLFIEDNPDFQYMTRDEIKNKLMSEWGMSLTKAINNSNILKSYKQNIPFPKKFINRYLHEKDNVKHNKNRQFELDTEHVLKHMGLKVEDHPEPVSSENNSNENEDTIITIQDKYLILVDAKNYHSKFTLSAELRNTMVNSYIKGYIGYENKTPRYFLYVVANDATSLENMDHITYDSAHILGNKCTGAIINANCLMQLASYEDQHKTNKVTNEHYLTKLCSTNKLFTTFGEIKDCLGLNG